jgi:hypothetical protein
LSFPSEKEIPLALGLEPGSARKYRRDRIVEKK